MPTLNWSDETFCARTRTDGWQPVFIHGVFGDPWLDEFPVGPSPTPYSFKAYRSPDGCLFKMAGHNNKARWAVWPMVEAIPLRVQPPEYAIAE